MRTVTQFLYKYDSAASMALICTKDVGTNSAFDRWIGTTLAVGRQVWTRVVDKTRTQLQWIMADYN